MLATKLRTINLANGDCLGEFRCSFVKASLLRDLELLLWQHRWLKQEVIPMYR